MSSKSAICAIPRRQIPDSMWSALYRTESCLQLSGTAMKIGFAIFRLGKHEINTAESGENAASSGRCRLLPMGNARLAEGSVE